MSKWNLIVDVRKCHNCANCFISAKDEYVGNTFPGYSAPQPLHGHEWIRIEEHERGEFPVVENRFVPKMCNHCDDAPCMKVGGDAVKKRPDGIVIIDPVKAKGREDIVKSCPYGSIFWNEEEQLPQHWTFDAHLLDAGWKEPRCSQVCPTGAIQSVKTDDASMKAIIEKENLRPIRSDIDTGVRVHYKNLDTVEKCFVAGTVSSDVEGVTECLQGAQVTLTSLENSTVTLSGQTDEYGDFYLDGLEPNSGDYQLVIALDGTKKSETTLTLDSSKYAGRFHI